MQPEMEINGNDLLNAVRQHLHQALDTNFMLQAQLAAANREIERLTAAKPANDEPAELHLVEVPKAKKGD